MGKKKRSSDLTEASWLEPLVESQEGDQALVPPFSGCTLAFLTYHVSGPCPHGQGGLGSELQKLNSER